MGVFKLQEEEYPGIYSELSEHDSFDAAMLAAAEMFDSNQFDDFFIQDTEEKHRFHIYGYMLTKETCPICGRIVRQYQMERTYDCHGIPFRMVCPGCREKIMEEPGYDGEYYDDLDEQIDPED